MHLPSYIRFYYYIYGVGGKGKFGIIGKFF
jgi:hypothetical protein